MGLAFAGISTPTLEVEILSSALYSLPLALVGIHQCSLSVSFRLLTLQNNPFLKKLRLAWDEVGLGRVTLFQQQ